MGGLSHGCGDAFVLGPLPFQLVDADRWAFGLVVRMIAPIQLRCGGGEFVTFNGTDLKLLIAITDWSDADGVFDAGLNGGCEYAIVMMEGGFQLNDNFQYIGTTLTTVGTDVATLKTQVAALQASTGSSSSTGATFPWNLSAADGAVLGAAILAVWGGAFAIRAAVRALRSDEIGGSEGA